MPLHPLMPHQVIQPDTAVPANLASSPFLWDVILPGKVWMPYPQVAVEVFEFAADPWTAWRAGEARFIVILFVLAV